MPTKRIPFIDALRGFTMILVVMNHVSANCFEVPWLLQDLENGCYSFTPIFREFRMPLFFFISGFVLFKAADVWNWNQMVAFYKKKIPVQLFSPFLFFAAYIFIFNLNFRDSICHPYKMGYWFTYTLFEFYVLYSVVRFFLYKLKARSIVEDVCLVSWGLLVTALSICLLKHKLIYDVLGSETWNFFIFFVVGTLVRKHYQRFELILDKGVIVVLSVLFFLVFNIFYQSLPEYFFYFIPTRVIVNLLLAASGVIIVFSFFRKHLNLQESYTPLAENANTTSDIQQFKAAPLQFIGRRTLDIYLLHFFFLPYSLSEVVPIFHEHPLPLLEMVSSLVVSIVVIAICLVVGSILRLNPLMAHHLFGAKIEKKFT